MSKIIIRPFREGCTGGGGGELIDLMTSDQQNAAEINTNLMLLWSNKNLIKCYLDQMKTLLNVNLIKY